MIRVYFTNLWPPLISEQSAIREFNPATQSAISSGGTGNFLLLLRPCTFVSDAGTLSCDYPHTKWTTSPSPRVTGLINVSTLSEARFHKSGEVRARCSARVR